MKSGAAREQRPACASDPTVAGPVLQPPRHSEQRGERGHGQVEEQLPGVPQAQQVQVA